MKQRVYTEPTIELIYVAVESGFTLSSGDEWGRPGETPTENDFGEF
ncbi:MAG: hypothetical protein J6R90_02180 [Alistipes sp.]|nr:hypothetical protein [Alistipes sp.]